jgi:hypothetical protein
LLVQAGPQHVYQPHGVVTEPGTTTQITTEITHHPAECRTVHYCINEDPSPIRVVRQVEPVNAKQNIRVRYVVFNVFFLNFYSESKFFLFKNKLEG